jgi:hypothetical protein
MWLVVLRCDNGDGAPKRRTLKQGQGLKILPALKAHACSPTSTLQRSLLVVGINKTVVVGW